MSEDERKGIDGRQRVAVLLGVLLQNFEKEVGRSTRAQSYGPNPEPDVPSSAILNDSMNATPRGAEAVGPPP